MFDEPKATCARCGYRWVVPRIKIGETGLLCRSCRASKKTVIESGEFRCIPHHGDFDSDLVTPMLNGNLYLPGKRICGKTDCVNVSHIEY